MILMFGVCNLQSRARPHAVLVIGLYELLGNPTTYPIEPPGSLGKMHVVYANIDHSFENCRRRSVTIQS